MNENTESNEDFVSDFYKNPEAFTLSYVSSMDMIAYALGCSDAKVDDLKRRTVINALKDENWKIIAVARPGSKDIRSHSVEPVIRDDNFEVWMAAVMRNTYLTEIVGVRQRAAYSVPIYKRRKNQLSESLILAPFFQKGRHVDILQKLKEIDIDDRAGLITWFHSQNSKMSLVALIIRVHKFLEQTEEIGRDGKPFAAAIRLRQGFNLQTPDYDITSINTSEGLRVRLKVQITRDLNSAQTQGIDKSEKSTKPFPAKVDTALALEPDRRKRWGECKVATLQSSTDDVAPSVAAPQQRRLRASGTKLG